MHRLSLNPLVGVGKHGNHEVEENNRRHEKKQHHGNEQALPVQALDARAIP